MRSGLLAGALLVASWIAPPRLAEEVWISYPHASGCYGGELCRANGKGVTVRLQPRSVLAIRFYAHDQVGETFRGRLLVRLDLHVLAREIDVARDGAVIELDAAGLAGRDLRLEVVGDDEVVVEDLEVRYAPI